MVAGLEVGIEPTVRLDDDNEPQPDAVLSRVDGNAKIDDDGYISSAPELIAEIAASTVSYDFVQSPVLTALTPKLPTRSPHCEIAPECDRA